MVGTFTTRASCDRSATRRREAGVDHYTSVTFATVLTNIPTNVPATRRPPGGEYDLLHCGIPVFLVRSAPSMRKVTYPLTSVFCAAVRSANCNLTKGRLWEFGTSSSSSGMASLSWLRKERARSSRADVACRLQDDVSVRRFQRTYKSLLTVEQLSRQPPPHNPALLPPRRHRTFSFEF